MLKSSELVTHNWGFETAVDDEVGVSWNCADSKQTECVADGKSERL